MSRFDVSIFDGENTEPTAIESIHLPWYYSHDQAIAWGWLE
jgi:hypothetical protein